MYVATAECEPRATGGKRACPLDVRHNHNNGRSWAQVGLTHIAAAGPNHHATMRRNAHGMQHGHSSLRLGVQGKMGSTRRPQPRRRRSKHKSLFLVTPSGPPTVESQQPTQKNRHLPRRLIVFSWPGRQTHFMHGRIQRLLLAAAGLRTAETGQERALVPNDRRIYTSPPASGPHPGRVLVLHGSAVCGLGRPRMLASSCSHELTVRWR